MKMAFIIDIDKKMIEQYSPWEENIHNIYQYAIESQTQIKQELKRNYGDIDRSTNTHNRYRKENLSLNKQAKHYALHRVQPMPAHLLNGSSDQATLKQPSQKRKKLSVAAFPGLRMRHRRHAPLL